LAANQRHSEGSPPPEDAALIERSKTGDAQAFRVLFEKHQGWVYGLAYHMVGSREEAADLTQEVFVRVFRALPTLRAGAAFVTWLRQIAVNLCRDYLKKRRLPTESLEYIGDQQEVVTRDLPDPGAELDRPVLTAELKVAVRRAIASLSPDHRAVVIMHHLQGMEVTEIARVLRCSVGTVKSRLSRARDELKRKLSGYVES